MKSRKTWDKHQPEIKEGHSMQWRKAKKRAMQYQTIHRKQRLSNTKPLRTGVNSGVPEVLTVPSPLVALVVWNACNHAYNVSSNT